MALSKERNGRITGSIAGAVLGLSPFKTREDVMQDFLYGSTFTGNAATEYGKFHEEYAMADFPHPLEPSNDGFVVHPEHDWLGCTPDGYSGDHVVEIKCPYGLREKESPEFKTLREQPHYYAQVQIEMACTGKDKAYFYQWNRFTWNIEEVGLDQPWLDENLPILKSFLDEVETRKLSLTSDEALAREYHTLKAALDDAKEKLSAHKEKLIDIAGGKKRKFGDVNVYPTVRKGTVSYSKVVKDHLPNLDLSPYTGTPTTVWTVK